MQPVLAKGRTAAYPWCHLSYRRSDHSSEPTSPQPFNAALTASLLIPSVQVAAPKGYLPKTPAPGSHPPRLAAAAFSLRPVFFSAILTGDPSVRGGIPSHDSLFPDPKCGGCERSSRNSFHRLFRLSPPRVPRLGLCSVSCGWMKHNTRTGEIIIHRTFCLRYEKRMIASARGGDGIIFPFSFSAESGRSEPLNRK